MNDAATSIAEEIGSRWKPYPVYKDSGVKWLGEIPEHWDVKRILYICSLNPTKSELGNLQKSHFCTIFQPLSNLHPSAKY